VYGSPLVLGVVQRHGSWLGVSTDALPNGHLGWVRADADSLLVKPITTSVTVDLSRRRLVVRERGRVVRALSVAVGRPGATTPTGRFAVTDKLAGRKYGSFYGCCVIALSGSAASGSRLAIHGGPGSSIGGAVSAGCLRARESDLRFLERRLRLGTPVFITQ